MALSGSQKAYLQARSGIARSGATRSGYYTGDAVITIDVGGVPTDISRHVVHNGWQISLNLNDEVDTASISLLPSLPFVPQTRSPIRIGFGSGSNVQFAGIILTVQRQRRPGPDPRDWYELTCIDWMALLDAHLVVASYPQQSVTTTILDIVARFTRGNISTAGVAAGLPSVPGFDVVHERPSTILRRITNKIGGGFYLDTNRVLRAWSASIPSPIQDSTPQPLTDHLPTLKTFKAIEDASQQRTRVWVEGRRTSTVLGVPAGRPSVVLPVADAGVFPPQAQITPDTFSRIGSALAAGPQSLGDPAVDASNNPPGALLTVAATPGSHLQFADTGMFAASGWVEAGGQVVSYTKQGTTLLLLPALGVYGSLVAPLAVGTQVVAVPWIAHTAMDRLATTTPGYPLEEILTRAQPQGSPVVLIAMKEDHTAATTIAARETSDGYYEHLVQDGRYSFDGALARANAELADFAQPLVTYEWDTEDLNAEPGRMQHIAFTEGTPLTTDVRITNVVITPIATKHPPRRQVRATKVITAGVVDVWVDEAR